MAVTNIDRWYEEEQYRHRLKEQMYYQQQAMINSYEASRLAAVGAGISQQSAQSIAPATPQPDKRLLLLEDTP